MPPKKGQSSKAEAKALDKQARTVRKKKLTEYAENALRNAFCHLRELQDLLDEETKENTEKRKIPDE